MAQTCKVCGSEACFDHCAYCGAEGCEAGTAVHTDDCPSETGVFPVSMELSGPGAPCEKCGHISREINPSVCSRCPHKFQMGELYHHIQIGDAEGIPIYEPVCAGCAAQEAVLS
jgi:hypothetical protein